MQQALPQEVVLTIIFVSSLWLQEVLTSTDLLLACVSGGLGYFKAFEEASLRAEDQVGFFSVRDLLTPTGEACTMHIHIEPELQPRTHVHRMQALDN